MRKIIRFIPIFPALVGALLVAVPRSQWTLVSGEGITWDRFLSQVSHADGSHLGNNLSWLLPCLWALQLAIRPLRAIGVALATLVAYGLVGPGLAVTLWGPIGESLGASGWVATLMPAGAMACLFHNRKAMENMDPWYWKGIVAASMMGAATLAGIARDHALSKGPWTHVGWQFHLAGYMIGTVMALVMGLVWVLWWMRHRNDWRRW